MSYEIVEGDLGSMPLTITLDGTPEDVSGADSVKLHWQKPNGAVVISTLTPVDATVGQFTMDWQAGDTNQVGAHFGLIVVIEDGTTTTYPNDGTKIIWWVNPGISESDTDDALISESEYLITSMAADPTTLTSYVSGTDTAVTLGDGVLDGFVKHFVITEGTGTITPDNFADGSTLTWTVSPANVSLIWEAEGGTWHVLGNPLNIVVT